MSNHEALDVLKSYPSDALVSDLYDHDEAFADALVKLFPGTFEYPNFSGRKIGDVVKSVEKLSMSSEGALAIEHRRLHMQFRAGSSRDNLNGTDFQAQLGLIEKMDTVGMALADKGWTNDGLSANALGVSVNHFRALVEQGTYAAGYGVPHAIRGRAPDERDMASLQKTLGVAQGGAQAPSHILNDQYANTIIGNNVASYDALEIHGVRDLNPPDHPDGTQCEIDEMNPQFYSVYAHVCDRDDFGGGGVECVGDFSEHAAAVEYAAELSEKHGYPVHDFSEQGKQLREEIAQSKSHSEQIAHEKDAFTHVDPRVNQTYDGKVMGVLDHHVVLSLGRKAAIFDKSMFNASESINPGSEITVTVGSGKAKVVHEKAQSVGISR